MVKGFIVNTDYVVEDEQAYVHLYGRLENDESFLVIKSFNPYFFIQTADKDNAKELIEFSADFEKTDMTNFDNEKVTKVILTNPKDVPKARSALSDNDIKSYEADVRFTMRYLMDNDIKLTVDINGQYTKGQVDRVYKEPELKPAEFEPNLRVLSIDIETSVDSSELYCVSLVTEKTKTTLLKSTHEVPNAEVFSNEKELLQRFCQLVKELDPDIITGWNVIDFDFKVLQQMLKDHSIDFKIARNDDTTRIFSNESWFSDSKMNVTGRVVLDGIHLMRLNYINLQDYKLDTFAEKYLGDKKTINGKDKGEQITDAFNNDPEKLVKYNLQDAELVLRLLKATNVLDITINRSMITGVQLDRVRGSVVSLDSLYLRELRKRKKVAPNTGFNRREERIKGGYVRESVPGIYDNVIVFDFKSIYPSIMRTFNIDPLSFVPPEEAKNYENLIEAPNKVYFTRTQGIIPDLIEEIWKKRDLAKKRKDDIESYSLKVLMNSIFGVLANPMCRFYNLGMANAITHFGQFFIKLCASEIEKENYEVIYGDTDSVFVNSKVEEYDKVNELARQLEKGLNNFLDKYIENNYNLKSFMQLEFEKVYKKLLMPRIRGAESGAKKRYAGIIEKDGKEEMDFVGLEFVRGDWTDLAKKFQSELLDKVFHGKSIEKYITNFVDQLKAGQMDNLLKYKKNIRKPVDEYTKTTPPHIQAARKINRKNPGMIQYIMTTDGPEPVELVDKKKQIDYQHYIDKQIKPIADSTLEFFDKSFDEILAKSKQKNLFDF